VRTESGTTDKKLIQTKNWSWAHGEEKQIASMVKLPEENHA